MKVEWTDRNNLCSKEVDTAHEALELLTEIAKSISAPSMVEFFNESTGRSVAVGVGRSKTVITYQDSIDPPYYISLGNKKQDFLVNFNYGNEESEYLGRNLVDFSFAIDAVRDFFVSKTRYEGIDWEKL
jgi:hypothetical protein